MSKRISIIDDDPAVVDSLRLLLQSRGFETDCHDRAQAFLNSEEQTDCVVSDVRMPGKTGIELLKEMQAQSDHRPVILLTGHGDIEMAVQAIKLGAFDFIEKPFEEQRLLASVREAVDKATESRAAQEEEAIWRDRLELLTDRQRETMTLLVQGLANKEIASRLGISPRTVEIHRTWVMNKMQARTLAELVRMGLALKIC